MQKSHLRIKMIHYRLTNRTVTSILWMPQCFFDEVASKYMKNLLEKGVETSQAITNIGRTIQRSCTMLFLLVYNKDIICYKHLTMEKNWVSTEGTKKILKKTYILWQPSFVKILRNEQNIYYSLSPMKKLIWIIFLSHHDFRNFLSLAISNKIAPRNDSAFRIVL